MRLNESFRHPFDLLLSVHALSALIPQRLERDGEFGSLLRYHLQRISIPPALVTELILQYRSSWIIRVFLVRNFVWRLFDVDKTTVPHHISRLARDGRF